MKPQTNEDYINSFISIDSQDIARKTIEWYESRFKMPSDGYIDFVIKTIQTLLENRLDIDIYEQVDSLLDEIRLKQSLKQQETGEENATPCDDVRLDYQNPDQ